jgi:hypothetical protein
MLVEWLKVKALSASPSTSKKKKQLEAMWRTRSSEVNAPGTPERRQGGSWGHGP